jgi:hypothetical protein
LAEIIDEHNQKAIEMFLLTADPAGEHFYWIGLTDLFHEGNFIWASTGEKATYLNWRKGEPNNANNRTEHFVHIGPISFERKWNDILNDCEDMYPFYASFALCQYSL